MLWRFFPPQNCKNFVVYKGMQHFLNLICIKTGCFFLDIKILLVCYRASVTDMLCIESNGQIYALFNVCNIFYNVTFYCFFHLIKTANVRRSLSKNWWNQHFTCASQVQFLIFVKWFRSTTFGWSVVSTQAHKAKR